MEHTGCCREGLASTGGSAAVCNTQWSCSSNTASSLIGWTFLRTMLHSGACSTPWFMLCGVRAPRTASWPPSLRELVTNSLPQGIATPSLGLLHFKPNPPSAFCPLQETTTLPLHVWKTTLPTQCSYIDCIIQVLRNMVSLQGGRDMLLIRMLKSCSGVAPSHQSPSALNPMTPYNYTQIHTM